MNILKGINNKEIVEIILNNSYNSVVITDANLDLPGPKIVYVNEAFAKNTGYTLEDLKDKTPRIFQGQETNLELLKNLKEKCKKGEFFVGETVNYRKDGSKYYVQWNISPIKNDAGEIVYYISIQRNVTKEIETIKTLQKILDLQKNIVIVTDGKKLSYVNESFKIFFDVSSMEDFLKIDDCVCSRFSEEKGFYYKKTEDENWIESILKLPHEDRVVSILDRQLIPHGFTVNINHFGDETSIITFTDITSTIGEKESFKHKAYHDNLSGAYNREFLYMHFEHYKEEVEKSNSQLGLILFDIDYFKIVNDTYGHNVGDDVIKKIVDTTLKQIRIDDNLIRWGGEEFIVMTKADNIKNLEAIATHIKNNIEKETFTPVPQVTASFGITLGIKADSLEALVKRADDGLYQAKRTGRNKVVATIFQS